MYSLMQIVAALSHAATGKQSRTALNPPAELE
jgi:hypothetical protein